MEDRPGARAGNSFILKPSEKSPLTAIRLAALAAEAGIPDGRVQRAAGLRAHGWDGRSALHMDVDCVGFTGSTAVGKLMLQYSGQSNMKRVWLECGGKSPNIVMADCPDLDRAASRGGLRDLLQPGRDVLGRIAAAHRGAGPRRGAREGHAAARAATCPATRWIPRRGSARSSTAADGHGARTTSRPGAGRRGLLAGSRRVRGIDRRLLRRAHGVRGRDPGMRIAREEIFGPVLAALTVRDADGRCGHRQRGRLRPRGRRVDPRRHARTGSPAALRAGMVYVNCYDADDITVPFGGFKQSGMGRDKSLHAFDKYTELKTTWIDLS